MYTTKDGLIGERKHGKIELGDGLQRLGFWEEPKIEYKKDGDKYPEKISVTIYKLMEGNKVPYHASARWSEYFPGDKQGFMWKKMPETMLEKCALSKVLRRAFPSDFSGIYTNEEMQQAEKPIAVKTEEAQEFIDSLDDVDPMVEALVQEEKDING